MKIIQYNCIWHCSSSEVQNYTRP